MANWLEEERERRRAATLAAIQASYARCVDQGDFEDSKEAWVAYVNGWFNAGDFRYAQSELTHAGSGYTGLTTIMWLTGGMCLLLPLFLLAVEGTEEFVLTRLVGMAAFGLVLVILGIPFRRKGQKVYEAALAKHREEWGVPNDG